MGAVRDAQASEEPTAATSPGRFVIVCLVVFACVLGVGLSRARAATSDGAMTPVAGDIDAADLPGATVFGDTPASTPEDVSFVLREQNLAQLETSVQHGVSQYLSTAQFARTFGESPVIVAQLQAYLARFGIATHVYPGNVDVQATGTAGQFDSALAVTQRQYHVPAVPRSPGHGGVPAQNVHGASQAPELPSSIARYVVAVLGLTNYGPFASQAERINPALEHPNANSSNSCVALTGLPDACHTPADFADEYGLTPLYRGGAEGRGQTLGIVTLAALDPGAPQYFWSNIAHLAPSPRAVTIENVDGGPGPTNGDDGSVETDLDVEQAGGVAPKANVLVYQAPNTDPGLVDGFFAAASEDLAGSVSFSWIESETYVASEVASGTETPAFQTAIDEAFLELAVQGQSGFAGSGDYGAYGPYADLGTTDLSLGSPSDSPYITSAGGTTLPFTGSVTGPTGLTATISVPRQRAWGWDYLWAPLAAVEQEPLAEVAEDPANVGGDGGGFSKFEPEPTYQRGVPGTNSYSAVPYLTPTDYQSVDGIIAPTAWNFDPRPPVIHGTAGGREDPDVSTNADPETGFLTYCPSCLGDGNPEPFGGYGGTSFVGPQLAGASAVIDSSLRRRVGLWNPRMYGLATQSGSPFTPLDQAGTSNDNLFYTGTPGAPYNPASGLGYPNLARLANGFETQP
jgi:subtilase family serine protease